MANKRPKKVVPKTAKKKVKPRVRRSLRPSFYGLFALALIFLVALWCMEPAQQWLRQRKDILFLNQKIAQLREDNSKLEEEKAKLNTEEYVEQVARKELGLVKPGEEAYVVIPPSKPSESPTSKAAKKEKPNIWQRVRSYLDKL